MKFSFFFLVTFVTITSMQAGGSGSNISDEKINSHQPKSADPLANQNHFPSVVPSDYANQVSAMSSEQESNRLNDLTNNNTLDRKWIFIPWGSPERCQKNARQRKKPKKNTFYFYIPTARQRAILTPVVRLNPSPSPAPNLDQPQPSTMIVHDGVYEDNEYDPAREALPAAPLPRMPDEPVEGNRNTNQDPWSEFIDKDWTGGYYRSLNGTANQLTENNEPQPSPSNIIRDANFDQKHYHDTINTRIGSVISQPSCFYY